MKILVMSSWDFRVVESAGVPRPGDSVGIFSTPTKVVSLQWWPNESKTKQLTHEKVDAIVIVEAG